MGRKGRIIALVAAVLLAVALAALLLTWSAPQTAPQDAPVVQRASPTPDATPTPTWVRPIQRATERAAPEARAPRTPHEEAMFAAIRHSGEGFVRCQLPPGMEVDVERLNWAGSSGGVLTMAATEPEGSVALHKAGAPPPPPMPERNTAFHELMSEAMESRDPKRTQEIMDSLAEEGARMEAWGTELEAWQGAWARPIALAVWSGAAPDTVGECTVYPKDHQVQVQVRARLADGSPAEGATVSAGYASATTDRAGEATLMVWASTPVTFRAFWRPGFSDDPPDLSSMSGEEMMDAMPRPRFAETTATVQAGATVTLELRPDEPWRRTPNSLDAIVDQAEDGAADHDTPLRAALEDPTLSPDARAQLQHWLDRSEAEMDQFYEAVDGLSGGE